MKARKGKEGVELGLAISRLSMKAGQTRTCRELAAYCGVSTQAIQQMERKALRKLRFRLMPVIGEMR